MALRTIRSLTYLPFLVCLCLGGCSASADGTSVLDRSLQAVGLQQRQPQTSAFDPAAATLAALPGSGPVQTRRFTLRLHAGDVVNTDAGGRSLSVVVRIYKLREKIAFEAAPYSEFQDVRQAKAPEFSSDIVDVQEMVLASGKQYDLIETVTPAMPYFGVVALFRAPAPKRWRFVFESGAVISTGVTIGIHACALSVSAGQALDVAPDSQRVGGVICEAPRQSSSPGFKP